MPNLLYRTHVNQPMESVWAGFDASLFVALKPRFVPMTLLRFDGCLTGNEVHIVTAGQRWEAVITQHSLTSTEYYFVDEGKLLPFPLRSWRHVHRIIASEKGCTIVDDITFSSGWKLIDALMYPILNLMFGQRKAVYQRLFA